MINGSEKGRRGELMVAKILMEWWRKLEPAASFIRTPLSGGWQHSDRKVAAHFKACGDVMTTAAYFPFCVEVKWRERWSPNHFLDGHGGPPWDWWKQTSRAAAEQDGVPMMWMRRNYIPGTRQPFPWLVLVPAKYADEKKLSEPDVRWTRYQLTTGGALSAKDVLPVAYDFTRWLVMTPERVRLPVKP